MWNTMLSSHIYHLLIAQWRGKRWVADFGRLYEITPPLLDDVHPRRGGVKVGVYDLMRSSLSMKWLFHFVKDSFFLNLLDWLWFATNFMGATSTHMSFPGIEWSKTSSGIILWRMPPLFPNVEKQGFYLDFHYSGSEMLKNKGGHSS